MGCKFAGHAPHNDLHIADCLLCFQAQSDFGPWSMPLPSELCCNYKSNYTRFLQSFSWINSLLLKKLPYCSIVYSIVYISFKKDCEPSSPECLVNHLSCCCLEVLAFSFQKCRLTPLHESFGSLSTQLCAWREESRLWSSKLGYLDKPKEAAEKLKIRKKCWVSYGFLKKRMWSGALDFRSVCMRGCILGFIVIRTCQLCKGKELSHVALGVLCAKRGGAHHAPGREKHDDLIELSAHVRSSSAAQAIISLLRASFSNASCRNRGDMLGHVLWCPLHISANYSQTIKVPKVPPKSS